MKTLGLIGHPLNHSKSPKLHQIIGNYLNRHIDYQLFDIADISDVKLLIDGLKKGTYNGFNVTIPYKETIIPFLDVLTPKAQKIGAVNTIYLKDDLVIGDNTDYAGFQYLFEKQIKIYNPNGIVILGSGGAAKACYTVCKDFGYDPFVVSRQTKSGESFDKVISYKDLEHTKYDLIINATPIGMYPNNTLSPLEQDLVKDKYVIDLIYNPLPTTLMTNTDHSIGGLDMLIVQALESQKIWFNEDSHINDDILRHTKEHLNE